MQRYAAGQPFGQRFACGANLTRARQEDKDVEIIYGDPEYSWNDYIQS